MSDQKICPTCGTEYPLSERFCPRDGTALRSANAQADLLGSVVADRYHILKKLGEGGMGTVYLAEHVKMGRKSALKVMNPGMTSDPDAIARFNREASNASRLSHPNICGIYDFGETPEGLIYLAMEFIEGSSLTSLIEAGGSLPAARAASIVHQTADALQVAHDAGIVHRDLKPDNIMVTKNRDGSDLVKVVDFGIAKASSSDAQKVTKTGLVVGTPEYMSPEQLAGDKLDGRSDIYSLGLVAFNCLTGTLPFKAESAQEAMIMRLTDRPRMLSEVKPDQSWTDAVQRTLDTALARDAAERYQSAAQFGREFAAAAADMPAVAVASPAEAGTLVLAATNVPAGKELAATRVARPSAATVAMEAPPKGARRAAAPAAAPAPSPVKTGSKVPMVVGIGTIATAAVVTFVLMSGNKAATATDPNAGAGGPGGTRPNAESTQVVTNPPGGGTESKTAIPAPASGTSGRSVVPEKSVTRDPGPTVLANSTTSTPVGGGPPTSGIAAQLGGWLDQLNAPNVPEVTARTIIANIESMRPSLTGARLAESHYIAMIAYVVLEETTGACREARLVKGLHSDTRRLDAADAVIGGCP